MTFKLTEFSNADLSPRLSGVKTPEISGWFEDGADPVFKVRGLTGEEFYHVRESVNKRRDMQAIASKILGGDGGAVAEAIEELYGAVPDEFVRRVEVLVAGCVEPAMDRPMAVKLLKHFPSTAHTVAEEILRATGEGSTVGEPKGSGETPVSAMTSI